jgi:hypothetical protein
MRRILLATLFSFSVAACADPPLTNDLTGLLPVSGQVAGGQSAYVSINEPAAGGSPTIFDPVYERHPQPDPARASARGSPTELVCHHINRVQDRVISTKAIMLPWFSCPLSLRVGGPDFGEVTMNVRLADPADASKMQPGKIVVLTGNFKLATENHVDYLIADDAEVRYIVPFAR